ncbi:MAG: hypothetical protein RL226_1436 [Bacteroidota bacterium]|jgi:light-regulated signal transduction histidine kinase (bacteriophytochrome)
MATGIEKTVRKGSTAELKAPQSDYERFLYSVSHDLQEPLRMITSFMKLFEAKAGDSISPEARQYLDYCFDNADKMKRMMGALVELSRVNRSSETLVKVDLNEVINDLFTMYSNELRMNEGVVEYDRLPEVIMAPSQAVQLLKVVIQNCFDFKSDRPLKISISAIDCGNFVEVTIKDNGKGINALYLDKMFEMFKKQSQNSEHTGSGLTIAREIVKRHGGTITLDSEEGKWTSVSFTLPKA